MSEFWNRKQLILVLVGLGVLAVVLLGWQWVLFEASVWQQGVGEITAVSDRLTMDPIGNTLAIVALVSMVCVVLLTVYRLNKQVTIPVSGWWAIPLLAFDWLCYYAVPRFHSRDNNLLQQRQLSNHSTKRIW